MSRPLRVGESIPWFPQIDSYKGRSFVLFFYPEDETPGCIVQACGFRDRWSEFGALGVALVGVSRDDASSHKAFIEKRRLPYELVSDEDGAMHAAFGAFMLGKLPRRVSYLIGSDGKVVAVYDSHTRPGSHAEKMLEAAQTVAKHVE